MCKNTNYLTTNDKCIFNTCLDHQARYIGSTLEAISFVTHLNFCNRKIFYEYSDPGNVTPIPTTGELEELSSVEDLTIVEDIVPYEESRRTPLKSLLKKPSFDNTETSSESDTDTEDGKISPKKVHFSEIDQVKLMSQDSLASMATSEGSDKMVLPITMCTTIMSTTPTPAVAKVVAIMASKQEELETALGDNDGKDKELDNTRREYII